MSLESALAAFMKKLSGPAHIDAFFPAEFIEAHTGCASAKEFFTKAGIVDQATFDAWTQQNPDEYVAAHSDFNTWAEMHAEAGQQLAQRRQIALRNDESIVTAPVNDTPFAAIVLEADFVAK